MGCLVKCDFVQTKRPAVVWTNVTLSRQKSRHFLKLIVSTVPSRRMVANKMLHMDSCTYVERSPM